MKTLVIKSNHGNHHGFSRKWEILKSFNEEENAQKFTADLHNEAKDIYEDDEDFETSISGFEENGYYYSVITQDDYNRGIFDGGHFGYASRKIDDFFEEDAEDN